jgi:sugar/nucleoside kinase (ribokinase family)
MKANYPVSIFAGRAVEDHIRGLKSLPKKFGVKTPYTSEHIFVGGSAPNAAIAHGMLGRKAFHKETALLYTPLGRARNEVVADLSQHGVTLRDCTPGNDFSLQMNFGFSFGKERTIHPDETPERNIYAEDKIGMPESQQRRLIHDMKDADIVMLECRCPLITTMVGRAAQDNNVPVVLDAGTWKSYVPALVNLSDIIIASHELEPENQSMTPVEIIGYFKSQGKENVAVTRGEESTLLNTPRGIIEIPVIAYDPVDTFASGDIMHGAFCFHFARSGDIAWSIEQANIAASESVRFFGPREGLQKMTADTIPAPNGAAASHLAYNI